MSRRLDALCTTLHNTQKLKEMILKYPDLPLLVFAGEEANTGDYSYMCCTDVSVEKGEVLDCEGPNDEILYTDRGRLEDDVSDNFYLQHEDEGISEDELDKKVKEELRRYDEHWKDCIILSVTN